MSAKHAFGIGGRSAVTRGVAVVMLALAAALVAAPAGASDKRIALTFDDAPLPDGPFLTGTERTATLIAVLRSAGAEQAAIFVTTGKIETPEDRARIEAYAKAGHVLANHSHTHQWAHRTQFDAYVADIDAAMAMLAAFDNTRPWYRFPYLDEGRTADSRDALRAALAERGLLNGYVTVDLWDWMLVDLVRTAQAEGACIDREELGALYVEAFVEAAEFYDALARETLGRAPAQVMLLHENDLAALYAADLVAGLRAAGWTIVTADEAFADPIAKEEPDTLHLGGGRLSALARLNGAPDGRVRHKATSEAYLRESFNARAVAPCLQRAGQ